MNAPTQQNKVSRPASSMKEALAKYQPQARAIQETSAAAGAGDVHGKVFGDEFGSCAFKAYRDNVLEAAGQPVDPVEVMLVEQLLGTPPNRRSAHPGYQREDRLAKPLRHYAHRRLGKEGRGDAGGKGLGARRTGISPASAARTIAPRRGRAAETIAEVTSNKKTPRALGLGFRFSRCFRPIFCAATSPAWNPDHRKLAVIDGARLYGFAEHRAP